MTRLVVNGAEVFVEPVGPESLLTTLRDRLAMRGSKNACEEGECGSCTVLLDGEPVCSCLVMTADAEGSSVITVEGIGGDGELGRVQQALVDWGGVQCGFCTPGMVVAATQLFEQDPRPGIDDIREALAGNICRCTGYGAILRALADLAGDMT